MKKTLFVLATCLTLSSAFAEGEKTIEVKKDKPIISNGFFLHFGLGFPAQTFKTPFGTASNSLGIQGGLELGNQWYFVKNDKFGVGLKVSWLQFGYSQKSNDMTSSFGTYSAKSGLVDLRFLKVSPMFSYAISEKMALDAYIDIAPTVMIGATTQTYSNAAIANTADASVGAGLLFVPGLRFRYNKFAAGFDFSVGSLSTASTKDLDRNGDGTIDSDDDIDSFKVTYFIPRVYVGFKF